MTDYALLASRHARRPLLLEAGAARDLANRVRTVDARVLERPSRVEALLRRVGLSQGGKGSRQPFAMEDDDAVPTVPMEARLAYSPRWLGEPEDSGFCWSLKDGVALMCCDTPLVERGDEFCGMVWHGYDTLLMGMREALADARVKALFLRLDTPGGVVAGGLPALAAFMRAARASAGGKPIWVYADMACSAGYWIAAQADRIVAPSVGLVGSIGAVIVLEDWSGALAQDGIAITSIEFPEGGLKTEGAWWKALGEAGQRALQSDINQVGESFVADVELGRPQLTRDAMIGLRADVFMGAHDDATRSGLALGLVDEIATEEEAFSALVAEISDPAEPQAVTAPGMRAGAQSEERPMANRTQTGARATAAAQVAAAQKALRTARANLARAESEDAAAEDAADQPAPEAADPEDEDTDPPADGQPDDDDDKESDGEASAEAQAIARSPEAAAHPELALAAISTGQSLAQFKANAATGGGKRASGLERLMAGSRRLSPDASAPQGQGQGLGAALVANARRRGGRD